MSTPLFVETAPASLYQALSTTDTQAVITPYPLDLDGNKLTIADFGSTATFTIDPKLTGYEEINGFTGIVDNGNNTATLTGLSRNLLGKAPYTASSAGGKAHGSSAVVVFSNNPQMYQGIIAYINGIALAGTVNATTSLQGLVQLATTTDLNAGTGTGSTGASLAATPSTFAASIYGLQLPSATEKAFLTQYALGIIGVPLPTLSKVAPLGFVMYDNSTYSRTGQYTNIFAILNPSQTFTVTIASPGVVSATAHGLVAGDRLHFTTTGGLPSGMAIGVEYFVLSTSLTSNTFKFALSPEGTAVVTSGSQNGIHTFYNHKGGIGDGLTTWTTPDFRSKMILGSGQGSQTIKFETSAIGTNTIALPSFLSFPYQGQAIVLTTTGALPTGITASTTYYVVRLSATSISLSSTQPLANAGTVDVTFTSSGSSGVHTITHTNIAGTVLGEMGGEENHGNATIEIATHAHTINTGGVSSGISQQNNGGTTTGSFVVQAVNSGTNTYYKNTDVSGGNAPHNNMSPFIRTNWMAKY